MPIVSPIVWRRPKRFRHFEVDHRRGPIAADLDHRHDVVGAVERFPAVGGRLHARGRTGSVDKPARDDRGRLEPLAVDVHQRERHVVGELGKAEQVSDERLREDRGAGADERDLQGHHGEDLMSTTFWAPGRVNLIGEHTDYSGGLVLPVAIQLGVAMTVEPAERIALVSDGDAVELAAGGTGETYGWGRYVAAVARELGALGRPAVGIEGVVVADLPRGAGLGASGALEVALALALCAVADFKLAAFELVLACQRAEQQAVGGAF
jgi:Galactokinase galactose-binding signature/GHMP kinases N terminal domain